VTTAATLQTARTQGGHFCAGPVTGGVPRLATEKQAAESIGLDLATFRAWVAAGKLPGPIPDCDKYDLKAVDAALDKISGLGSAANSLDAWRVTRARQS
jgi:hypothetical protein